MHSTESAVLTSARRCFARSGYRKTSVDEIAVDAGVAKGTVYLYCEGKRDLFVRALVAELDSWLETLHDIAAKGGRADDTLIEMGLRHRNFVEERPLLADLMTGATDALLPDQRSQLDELRRRSRSVVADVIRVGITDGVFNAALDVDTCAEVLQELQVAGAVLRHHSNLSLAAVRKRQAATVALVLDGLRVRPDQGATASRTRSRK